MTASAADRGPSQSEEIIFNPDAAVASGDDLTLPVTSQARAAAERRSAVQGVRVVSEFLMWRGQPEGLTPKPDSSVTRRRFNLCRGLRSPRPEDN